MFNNVDEGPPAMGFHKGFEVFQVFCHHLDEVGYVEPEGKEKVLKPGS